MKIRKLVIGAVLVILGLPVALVLTVMASIYVLDRTNGTIVSSGQQRQYLLYVPTSYDRAKPTPLVISMHAAAGWPAQQRNLSRWNPLADEQGFLIVYPSGSDVPKIWHVGRGAGLMRDVRFIAALIDTLEVAYNIDPARIYANGISNGGAMAFVLSCTLSDRIAAVGLVAPAHTLPSSWCTDHRPVPMIAFHGSADPIVPYRGGPTGDPFNPVKDTFPAVQDWVASWARRNRCGANSGDSLVSADVTRREYPRCAGHAAVVLYTIQGGGHSWPGGKPLPGWWVGPTSKSIDATRQMWAFFRDHRLLGNSEQPTVPLRRLRAAGPSSAPITGRRYIVTSGRRRH
jgi:polyhydroxybutyrate depolymerase